MKHLNLVKKSVNSKFTQKSIYSRWLLVGSIITINMCISNVLFAQITANGTITVNALPAVSITGSSSICAGATTTLSPTSGGTWTSSDMGIATVTNGGVITGVSAGSATFTFTNSTTGCSITTSAVTVNTSSNYNICYRNCRYHLWRE